MLHGRRRSCRAGCADVVSRQPRWDRSTDAEHAAGQSVIARARGKIVERLCRYANDMVPDERRAFGGARFRMLETAFPLQHGPTRIAVLREPREDTAKIDLTVAERAKAPRPV